MGSAPSQAVMLFGTEEPAAPVRRLAAGPLTVELEAGNLRHVMIGGGHKGVGDLETGQVQLDVERLAFSARTALDLFPILAQAKLVHAWAGLEGVLPDEIPVVGLSRQNPGLVHAFGFCGHGFELGPLMGGIVAGLALDGATNWPIAAFAPDRFGHAEGEAGAALLQPAG